MGSTVFKLDILITKTLYDAYKLTLLYCYIANQQ